MDSMSSGYTRERLQELILNHFFGYCTVIDKTGRIVYSLNADSVGISEEKYENSMLEEWVSLGYFKNSPTLKALQSGKIEMDWIGGKVSEKLVTISKPVFDKNGQIEFVIGYGQSEGLLVSFLKKVDEEKALAAQTIEYLNDIISPGLVIAKSDGMKRICATVKKAARSDAAVILSGESGTGKEVLAQYLHSMSCQKDEIFLPVNCAAIPSELMEAEFFGYEKGAFTGADVHGKIGLFELASKGTLFLDEIGELPLALQTKLLRALETKEIKRIGGTKSIKTHARIIAATNRNLEKMISEGSFREDLFYRLNVVSIHIPPIRERRDDIEPLMYYFLDEFNKKYKMVKSFSLDTVQYMNEYDWPGNVREIRNIVERLYIISEGDVLTLDGNLFCKPVKKSADKNQVEQEPEKPDQIRSLRCVMDECEKKYIAHILQACGGNVSMAARKMQLSRAALYKKIKYLCI